MANSNNQTKTDAKSSDINIPNYIAMESAIGSVLLIASKSLAHKYIFTGDYEWMIIPPIATKQFVLFRNKNNEPIAFVSFASINDEVEKRLLGGSKKLAPADWSSGKKFYIIDVISPFAPASQISKELSENQFKNKEINLLKPSEDKKTLVTASLKEFLKELNSQNNDTKKTT